MDTRLLRSGKWVLSAAAGAAMALGVGMAPIAQASSASGGAACEGLREDAGFLNSSDHEVAKVQPLRRMQRIGKAEVFRTVGARVTLHAQEGVNAQYLQRVLKCQLPREMTQASEDTAPAVKTQVHESTDGLLVDIEAEDASQGRHVEGLVRRALESRGAPVVD